MGLKELKTIYNVIIEIATENNINPKEAIQQFFDQLNEYDKYIDIRKKILDSKTELANLNLQISNNRTILEVQPHIGEILQTLLRIGISEKDIADINSILLLGGFNYYGNNRNNIIINKQSLISELTKYRNIKLVIKSMEQNQIQLANNIEELENQKKMLENYINLLLIIFFNLREFQILLKKANTIMENPIMILLYLFTNEQKDDDHNTGSEESDDTHKNKKSNYKYTDEKK